MFERALIALLPAGALLPAVLVYLTYFYPRRMLQLRYALVHLAFTPKFRSKLPSRLAVMYSATSFAVSMSSLLAAGIVRIQGLGKRPGYVWLFLLVRPRYFPRL